MRVFSALRDARALRPCPWLQSDHVLADAVHRARAGTDIDASFRVIDERLRSRLHAYFASHGASGYEADDLVQNVLVRVYQGVRDLRDEEKFMAWLFCIARNVRLSAVEARFRTKDVVGVEGRQVENLPDPSPSASLGSEGRKLAAVWAAVEELPPQQRQCVQLRVRDEMSYDQIARTLRISVHTVRNHLSQALKTLRRSLSTQEGSA